jgi:predicted dehydrogenase
MNWDQWCGPSPARPYHKIYHYGNWRPWWDFGTGNLGDVACHALHVFHDELEMGAPDWVAADACQAFSPGGRVEQRVRQHRQLRPVALSGARQTPGDDGVLLRWRPATAAAAEHAPEMGMPGRGMMFVGEKGVQVSAFYGGSPSLPDHNGPQPGQKFQGTPRRLAPAGEPFQGLQAARAILAAVREAGSLRRVDTGVQSRQEVDHAHRVRLRFSRNSPCSGPPRCAATARPGMRGQRGWGPADRTPRWCGFPPSRRRPCA